MVYITTERYLQLTKSNALIKQMRKLKSLQAKWFVYDHWENKQQGQKQMLQSSQCLSWRQYSTHICSRKRQMEETELSGLSLVPLISISHSGMDCCRGWQASLGGLPLFLWPRWGMRLPRPFHSVIFSPAWPFQLPATFLSLPSMGDKHKFSFQHSNLSFTTVF